MVGTFALVVYTYPYLSPAFAPLVLFCVGILRAIQDACLTQYLCAAFYRQTSREVKRVDSVTRSAIYTAFSEQVSRLHDFGLYEADTLSSMDVALYVSSGSKKTFNLACNMPSISNV